MPELTLYGHKVDPAAGAGDLFNTVKNVVTSDGFKKDIETAGKIYEELSTIDWGNLATRLAGGHPKDPTADPR